MEMQGFIKVFVVYLLNEVWWTEMDIKNKENERNTSISAKCPKIADFLVKKIDQKNFPPPILQLGRIFGPGSV